MPETTTIRDVNVLKAIAAKAEKKAAKAGAKLALHWTRTQAIKAKCLECSNQQPVEVRRCIIRDCPLIPFRYGASVPLSELKDWEERFMKSRFGQWFFSRHTTTMTSEESVTVEEEVAPELPKASPKLPKAKDW